MFGVVTDFFLFGTPYGSVRTSFGFQLLWAYNTYWIFWGSILVALLLKARVGPFVGFISIWKGTVISGLLLGGIPFLILA